MQKFFGTVKLVKLKLVKDVEVGFFLYKTDRFGKVMARFMANLGHFYQFLYRYSQFVGSYR